MTIVLPGYLPLFSVSSLSPLSKYSTLHLKMVNFKILGNFLILSFFVSTISCGRKEVKKNPAKYSTGAPTDDNPIIYNIPGSDAEEKKETEDSTGNCVDHCKYEI